MRVVLIGLLGAAGALARYGLATQFPQHRFPWTIMAINVTGAFVLGCLLTAERTDRIDPGVAIVIGIGFLGAFTTFSTLSWDSFDLLRNGHAASALLNSAGSLLLGIGAAGSGYWLTSQWAS